MDLLGTASLLMTVTALFAYINYRFIRLPVTIGVMVISLVFSMVLVLLSKAGLSVGIEYTEKLLSGVDFDATLMEGMLSFLLFAGALHINLNELLNKQWVVGILASVGVITSTVIVGLTSWIVLNFFGLELPLIYCMLFGSLIAPTDPVAVLAILKTAGASKSLETKIAGESLFNDGIAVVVFLVILGIAVGDSHAATPLGVARLFVQETIGGGLFGLFIGWICYRLLKTVDNYHVEVLLTLALVMGGYAAARAMHISGPIAIVVAGLLIGNHGRRFAMSDRTRENLDTFWELLDEILNAVLFMLIGLEIIVLNISGHHVLAGILMFFIVLCARFIAVGIPVSILKLRQSFHPHVVSILTWGGIRGGISVALALSLPIGPERSVIVSITYVIVIMSVILQGLSIKSLVQYAATKYPTESTH
ncbi:sodium:proton antiporter [Chromatiales bacterium (ex Bugula neritina AB1)]|nr:sodium:proton antiporter [Chromatiales bacterium (ex Bugula neritina AB1)]